MILSSPWIVKAVRGFGGIAIVGGIAGAAFGANWVNPHNGQSAAPIVMTRAALAKLSDTGFWSRIRRRLFSK